MLDLDRARNSTIFRVIVFASGVLLAAVYVGGAVGDWRSDPVSAVGEAMAAVGVILLFGSISIRGTRLFMSIVREGWSNKSRRGAMRRARRQLRGAPHEPADEALMVTVATATLAMHTSHVSSVGVMLFVGGGILFFDGGPFTVVYRVAAVVLLVGLWVGVVFARRDERVAREFLERRR